MNQFHFPLHKALWLLTVLAATILIGGFSFVPAQAGVPAQSTEEPTTTNTPVPVPTVNFARTVTPVAQTATIRIGYQRGGIWLLLKNQELLEKRFGPNVTITWTIFPSGPPLLEALNVDSVDIGSTGDTPPIFAQAAGTPLNYVATSLGSGAGQAIIVPSDSPIKSLADLKGKKIAFQRASASHLLLIRALEKAGLTYTDIEPVFLSPADARAAFQGGSIDAWVIWDPFYTSAVQELNAKTLIDGKNVSPTRAYYLASESFIKDHPDLLRGIIEELQTANEWTKTHKDEYAQIQANETGVPLEVWKKVLENEIADINFIDQDTIDYQQEVAQIFYDLGLIPNELDIKAAVWIPEDQVAKK